MTKLGIEKTAKKEKKAAVNVKWPLCKRSMLIVSVDCMILCNSKKHQTLYLLGLSGQEPYDNNAGHPSFLFIL